MKSAIPSRPPTLYSKDVKFFTKCKKYYAGRKSWSSGYGMRHGAL